MPLHPLIPIAPALSFTFFAAPPSTATLNVHNGSRSALLPPGVQDAPHPQALDSDGGVGGFERYTWFSIDDDLVYLSFYEDWGPLNIAMFYRFCLHVHHLMESDSAAHLVLYTSSAPQQKANAALLVALYSMIIERQPVADAFHPFSQIEFQPFRDAGYGRADFHLSLQDVLHGVSRALQCELLNLSAFNLDEYEHYEQVANGDWNWLTPNFIAFASPNDREYTNALRATMEGRPSRSLRRPIPETFRNTIRYFRDRGVGAVVRLNNPLYDRAEFENAGIKHVDMYFDDGSNPSEEILRDFIALADAQIAAGRVVAVHCKAGLGRTGVLIGAYLIWRHGFSASEVIGFMRFMRPGCVVGPQQHFMYENATEWVRWRVRHEMRLELAKE
ncbi:phosphatases II, partial [Tilletiopsis washingtonensis]